MHGGRGDEAYPEVHEGVVLPAQGRAPEPELPPAWSSGPAGGQPWGRPVQQDPYYGHQAPVPDSDATQMFPPYPQAQPPVSPDAGQPLPQFQGQADATQLLPPFPAASQSAPFDVRSGAPGPADATQHLPRYEDLSPQQAQHLPQPQSPAAPAYGYPQEPQPEPQDDFGHLYRQDSPSQQQNLQPQAAYQPPVYQQQQAYQQQPPAPSYDAYDGYEEPRRGRKLSPMALIGIVVGGCAIAGLLAGALMSGGDDGTPAASSSQSPDASGSSAAPNGSGGGASAAENQAKQLDQLLRQSGGSRTSVINAVANITNCDDLDQAAGDLRAAAKQRGDLMARLKTLPVDQLPRHQELVDALNKAWTASAAADNHYAAWADQVKQGKRMCKHGKARNTPQTAAGNNESGNATHAKKTAVGLWNSIAKKYDLTEHQYTQI
ncbi:hypothetical protein ACFYXS_17610 [Streptomyces sp. NPDC002574]|uniref:hypothetical protein n=1 Tax=Streptomyces sp. NPDC002574 TaxID=3364652 RepID=UPI0036B1D794